MQTVALRGWEIIPGPSPIAELRAAQGGRPAEYLSVFRGRPTPAGDADRRLGRREGIVSQPLSVARPRKRSSRSRRAAMGRLEPFDFAPDAFAFGATLRATVPR